MSKSDATKILDSLTEKLSKALTASAISGIVRRMRAQESVDAYKAGIAQNQPEVGVNRVTPSHEPPVVPVRHVEPALPETPVASEFHSCVTCGTMHKSIEPCRRCEYLRSTNKTATEFWRR